MATPLLHLLDGLRADSDERAAFTNDPEGFLASHGWSDLDPSELREALGFVRESTPIDIAVTLPDDPADLAAYVERFDTVEPDDVDFDFGADAIPAAALPDVEIAVELEHEHAAQVDDEPLTVDLGPSDDDLDADEDDDEDDDPLDL